KRLGRKLRIEEHSHRLNRRKLVEQLPKGDLNTELLLKGLRNLGQKQRIKPKLEECRARIEGRGIEPRQVFQNRRHFRSEAALSVRIHGNHLREGRRRQWIG